MSIELDLELEGDLPLMEPSSTLWWRVGATDTRAVDLVQVRLQALITTVRADMPVPRNMRGGERG